MYACMYVCKVCIKHSGNENKGNSYQLAREALHYETNSSHQYFWKCIENSMENMHTDVWV